MLAIAYGHDVGYSLHYVQMAREKEIGQRILEKRRELGLSQEDLAGRTGLDRSFLSEIENGHKNISVNTLYRLAEAMNVSAAYLLGEE